MGIDTDQGLYKYFRRYYCGWFPGLLQITRTTFVRQAANLWMVKFRLWQFLMEHPDFDPAIFLVDSLPVPVCRFA